MKIQNIDIALHHHKIVLVLETRPILSDGIASLGNYW